MLRSVTTSSALPLALTVESAVRAVGALCGAQIDAILFAALVDRAVSAAMAAGEAVPEV